MEGGTGHRTELTCLVHAEPRADVTWYKNAMLLDLGTREEGESWEMDDLLKYFFFSLSIFPLPPHRVHRSEPGSAVESALPLFAAKFCFKVVLH